MFITFEGTDGGGKSTQIPRLGAQLRARGYEVVTTRDPGGTAIGDQIRDVLHRLDNEHMHPVTELLLYSASRAQMVNEVVRPALAQGKVVLADRFYDSTTAYQGYGRGLDQTALGMVTKLATGGLAPDLTLYFDLPPALALDRRKSDQQAEWNRMDAEELAFHQRVYDGYRKLIAEEPQRWVVIDANQSVEAVERDVLNAVVERLHIARS
ncbi:MAG: dTMP kinase [Chloroflexi bacterium]|nr:dTMP kinase [Chloroflexota bacterium]